MARHIDISLEPESEVVHADICGPFCHSFSNYRYFVLFKDDYSGFRFVYLMREKSEVSEKLKWMLAESKALVTQ